MTQLQLPLPLPLLIQEKLDWYRWRQNIVSLHANYSKTVKLYCVSHLTHVNLFYDYVFVCTIEANNNRVVFDWTVGNFVIPRYFDTTNTTIDKPKRYKYSSGENNPNGYNTKAIKPNRNY